VSLLKRRREYNSTEKSRRQQERKRGGKKQRDPTVVPASQFRWGRLKLLSGTMKGGYAENMFCYEDGISKEMKVCCSEALYPDCVTSTVTIVSKKDGSLDPDIKKVIKSTFSTLFGLSPKNMVMGNEVVNFVCKVAPTLSSPVVLLSSQSMAYGHRGLFSDYDTSVYQATSYSYSVIANRVGKLGIHCLLFLCSLCSLI
jgi:hypothetical protein